MDEIFPAGETNDEIAEIERKQKGIREKLDGLDGRSSLSERSTSTPTTATATSCARSSRSCRWTATPRSSRKWTWKASSRSQSAFYRARRTSGSSPRSLRSSACSRCSFRRDPLRRQKACWNRHNATGFQLLKPCFGAEKRFGGPDRDRTGDLLNAIQARSQLRYRPIWGKANPNLNLFGRDPSKADPPLAARRNR